MSVSLDGGWTRKPQCVPCGSHHDHTLGPGHANPATYRRPAEPAPPEVERIAVGLARLAERGPRSPEVGDEVETPIGAGTVVDHDGRTIAINVETEDWAAWEIDVLVSITPKHGNQPDALYQDAAVMRYPSGWAERHAAATYLREVADSIDRGEIPRGQVPD